MSGDDPSALSEAIESAIDRFEYGRGSMEEGFETADSEAATQLRKACRLLAAVRSLREVNGFHTAVVERYVMLLTGEGTDSETDLYWGLGSQFGTTTETRLL